MQNFDKAGVTFDEKVLSEHSGIFVGLQILIYLFANINFRSRKLNMKEYNGLYFQDDDVEFLFDLENELKISLPIKNEDDLDRYVHRGMVIEKGQITVLNLYNTNLISIPKSIKNLSKLRKLLVKDSDIKDISLFFCSLPSLAHLDISDSRIYKKTDEIIKFRNPSLINLVIKHTNLNAAPDLSNLVKLEYLDFSINSFGIPLSIIHLLSLKILKATSSNIKVIPDQIGNLRNLEIIYFDMNHIRILPDSMKDLTRLEILILAKNKIETLGNTITKFTSLKTLNLAMNKIIDLPSNIGKLSNLKELNLMENNIKILPSSIKQLKKLEILNIGMNYLINELPFSPIDFPNLKELHITPELYKKYKDEIDNLYQEDPMNFILDYY